MGVKRKRVISMKTKLNVWKDFIKASCKNQTVKLSEKRQLQKIMGWWKVVDKNLGFHIAS